MLGCPEISERCPQGGGEEAIRKREDVLPYSSLLLERRKPSRRDDLRSAQQARQGEVIQKVIGSQDQTEKTWNLVRRGREGKHNPDSL
jgi:hypothetical protein